MRRAMILAVLLLAGGLLLSRADWSEADPEDPAPILADPSPVAPPPAVGSANRLEESEQTRELIDEFEAALEIAEAAGPDRKVHLDRAATTLSLLRPVLYGRADGKKRYSQLERRLEEAY